MKKLILSLAALVFGVVTAFSQLTNHGGTIVTVQMDPALEVSIAPINLPAVVTFSTISDYTNGINVTDAIEYTIEAVNLGNVWVAETYWVTELTNAASGAVYSGGVTISNGGTISAPVTIGSGLGTAVTVDSGGNGLAISELYDLSFDGAIAAVTGPGLYTGELGVVVTEQ